MKRSLILIIATLFCYQSIAFAHPGNTDVYGCHTCRAQNCAKYGLYYGEYPCHSPKTYKSSSYANVYKNSQSLVKIKDYLIQYNQARDFCWSKFGMSSPVSFEGEKVLCACSSGYVYDEKVSNKCLPFSEHLRLTKICPSNQVVNIIGVCECKKEYALPGGGCKTIPEKNTYSVNATSTTLYCPSNSYRLENRCVCGAGYISTDKGCFPLDSSQHYSVQSSCPANSSLVNNRCTCNQGYKEGISGCIKP